VTSPSDFQYLSTGAWCYYNNDFANGVVYGKLYNWYAVAGIYDGASLIDASLRKKLAPIGWHVPNTQDFLKLNAFLGGTTVAGGKMKEIGTTHWNSPNTGATNSSGFASLPGGSVVVGSFAGLGSVAEFWSSDPDYSYGPRSNPSATSFAYTIRMSSNYVNSILYSEIKSYAYSVRCLSDQLLNSSDQTMNIQFSIYPNPTTSILTLQNSWNINVDKVIVTDLSGKVLLEQIQNTTQINVEQFASGMYILQAFSEEKKYTSKFIKK
jgi:uncharacterized protein (TIGR02145 family)